MTTPTLNLSGLVGIGLYVISIQESNGGYIITFVKNISKKSLQKVKKIHPNFDVKILDEERDKILLTERIIKPVQRKLF